MERKNKNIKKNKQFITDSKDPKQRSEIQGKQNDESESKVDVDEGQKAGQVPSQSKVLTKKYKILILPFDIQVSYCSQNHYALGIQKLLVNQFAKAKVLQQMDYQVQIPHNCIQIYQIWNNQLINLTNQQQMLQSDKLVIAYIHQWFSQEQYDLYWYELFKNARNVRNNLNLKPEITEFLNDFTFKQRSKNIDIQQEFEQELQKVMNLKELLETAIKNMWNLEKASDIEYKIKYLVHNIFNAVVKGTDFYIDAETDLKVFGDKSQPADFMISRKNRNQGIVVEVKKYHDRESKKEKLSDGMGQNFRYLRQYGILKQREVVYGILTNYYQWYITKVDCRKEAMYYCQHSKILSEEYKKIFKDRQEEERIHSLNSTMNPFDWMDLKINLHNNKGNLQETELQKLIYIIKMLLSQE